MLYPRVGGGRHWPTSRQRSLWLCEKSRVLEAAQGLSVGRSRIPELGKFRTPQVVADTCLGNNRGKSECLTSVLPQSLPGDVGVHRRPCAFHSVAENVPALQRHQEGTFSGGVVQEMEAPAVQRVPVITIRMEAKASKAVAKFSILEEGG